MERESKSAMEGNEEDRGQQNQNQNPNTNPNQNQPIGPKGKSCKGTLYYTTLHKSKSRNPTCVGISRSLPQVPRYNVGESELEAAKEGRTLTDFKYACVGYSVYLDKKGTSTDEDVKAAELPLCVGLEILLDKRPASASQSPAPAHAQRKEDGHSHTHPPRMYKPPHVVGNEFVRNAGLVASGVARNLTKVGNYIKHTVDDILYPNRRRPK
ncbi:hypothetical protein RJ641_013865 [Dillenia turbinata]|uniref:DUF8204 domain-containing protein n=1 Tax=Dillenia turbinata TaxID=194707 RepID=A0AAN8ZQF8_9MAGN